MESGNKQKVIKNKDKRGHKRRMIKNSIAYPIDLHQAYHSNGECVACFFHIMRYINKPFVLTDLYNDISIYLDIEFIILGYSKQWQEFQLFGQYLFHGILRGETWQQIH
jgi:hypothetical protein